MRHAKSSWDSPDMADFDRPLNKRGLLAAPFMGNFLSQNNFRPDLILSSPAKRAQETADLLKDGGRFTADIRLVDGIYEASPLSLLKIIRSVDEKVMSPMLVGHNPGLEGFIAMLTGQSQRMPTAAIAKIELKINTWFEIRAECGTLERIMLPKQEMI